MGGFRALVESLMQRRRGLAWLLALVLLNGAVFVALTHRLANKQERLTEEKERLGFQLEQERQELALLEEENSRLSRNAEAVSHFWNDVVQPRAPGLTDAWDEIDRLAGETSVARRRTGYEREILDVGLERIRATMPVEGSYFDLVRFINRLERSNRLFLVEEIRFSQREPHAVNVQLDCTITFYLKAGIGVEEAGP